MELNERLKAARKAKKLSQADVAEKIEGLSQSAYSQLESGKSKTTTKGIELAKLFGVSPEWLATGQGEMTPTPILQSNVSAAFRPIEDWDDSTPLEADEVSIPFYKDFAFACGHGAAQWEAIQDEKRRLRISKRSIARIGSDKDSVFATIADGDSMAPTIVDGATIWVDTSKKTIKDGRIFVFEHGGLFLCKRLYRLPNNAVRVVSDNSIDFPEYIITDITTDFRLIGWVWHWSVMERW